MAPPSRSRNLDTDGAHLQACTRKRSRSLAPQRGLSATERKPDRSGLGGTAKQACTRHRASVWPWANCRAPTAKHRDTMRKALLGRATRIGSRSRQTSKASPAQPAQPGVHLIKLGCSCRTPHTRCRTERSRSHGDTERGWVGMRQERNEAAASRGREKTNLRLNRRIGSSSASSKHQASRIGIYPPKKSVKPCLVETRAVTPSTWWHCSTALDRMKRASCAADQEEQ